MDTTAGRRKIRKIEKDPEGDFYPHDVNMYIEPPATIVQLAEFEELALERLQLLRVIEQASLKGSKPYSEEWKKTIKEDLSKIGLKKYIRLMSGYNGTNDQDNQARRADHISHFILRLAYCRSEDLRRWFISKEMDWFKIKFLAQTPQGVMDFLKVNNLTYRPISEEEKSLKKNELVTSTPGVTDVSVDATDFYKVPFTDVLLLVKNRRVHVTKGYAYIPTQDLVVCIQTKFRAKLSEALNVSKTMLPYLDDERINSLLSNLHNMYTGKSYVIDENDTEHIDPAHLDAYAKKQFPLCMRHLHEVLRTQHHLKHKGRLTYGLFLKGIGLSYEDAMDFWRQEFTKKLDSDKFEKQYAYNIKHTYGKVGNMTNYSPYSCVKIITDSVGPGEHHGCPFKHWDASVVKQKLVEHGIGAEGVTSVMDLVTNGHYQIACTKYFEYVHGQAPSTTINHPNQYFQESINLAKEKSSRKN
ncbi:unnamed protein product [Acanthoscelides obtectus]|uniref:DNA primase large subunit n=1 Tax=Acanthoscelides obtectus TaxID=200917 RepID=A0A9P0LX69_ACAOB|nr:unnamed protein product [Acanthoscelides obtectus]CAK1664033.1 DNA primase large subunit [Acanthoscelides obtectus]